MGLKGAVQRTKEAFDKVSAKNVAGGPVDALQEAQQAGWRAIREAHQQGVPQGKQFTDKDLRAGIMSSDVDSAPGPSGLSIMHLQQMILHAGSAVASLLSNLAKLGTAAYSNADTSPPEFWYLHAAANLTALGEKARPIACGDTLRRQYGRLYCRSHKDRFSALLESVTQYGVAVPGGAERLATLAQLIYDADGVLLDIDSRNAFNEVDRAACLTQAALHVPDAYQYTASMYGAGASPPMLFPIAGCPEPEVIVSRQGVQQGDPLGPLLFALALMPIMRDFKEAFPHLVVAGYLDDLIVGIILKGSLPDHLSAAADAFEWLQERLLAIGLHTNLDKTLCLVPEGKQSTVGSDADLAELVREQVGVKAATGAGIELVGVPIGPDSYIRSQATDKLYELATGPLPRALVDFQDAQLAFQMLVQCYIPRAGFLLRNVPPDLITVPLHRFDAVSMAAAAAIMQEGSAASAVSAAGTSQPDWDAALQHVYSESWQGLPPVALSVWQQQQLTLPRSKGGFGVTVQSSRSYSAFVARAAASLPTAIRALPPAQRTILDEVGPARLPSIQHVASASRGLAGIDGMSETMHNVLSAGLASADSGMFWRELQQSAEAAAPPQVHSHIQAALSRAATKASVERFKSNIDALPGEQRLVTLARFNSQSTDSASMAFLSAPAGLDYHLGLSGAEMREALRRNLGLCRPANGGLCPKCEHPQSGFHAATCSRTGEQTFRHHRCCEMFSSALKQEVGVQSFLEQQVPLRPGVTASDAYFMDITVPPGQIPMPPPMKADGTVVNPRTVERDSGNTGLIDWSFTNPAAAAFRSAAAKTPGHAAEVRAQQKYDKYLPVMAATNTLIPFVVEQFGRMSPQARALLKVVAKQQSERAGGAHSYAHCLQRFRQRISVATQRTISDSVGRLWSKTRPLPGAAAPDLQQFAKQPLLLRQAPPRHVLSTGLPGWEGVD